MPTRTEVEAAYFGLYVAGKTTREIAQIYRVGKGSVCRHLRNYCLRNGLDWRNPRMNYFARLRTQRLAAMASSKSLDEAASRLSLRPEVLDGWIYRRRDLGDPVPWVEKGRWSVRS